MNHEKVDIEELLKRAQKKDKEAINSLLSMFQPLLKRNSYVNGQLNEDFFQELSIEFLKSIEKFKIKE